MDTDAYFADLNSSGTAALAATFADLDMKIALGKTLEYCQDWHVWTAVLKARGIDSEVLTWAVKELQLGAYLAATAHYRSAVSQIRLFIELGLSALEFSTNEIARRKWLAGNRDMSFNALVDEKSGMYSQDFCKTFFIELAGESSIYLALVKSTYRDCSDFVHGGASTHRKIEHKVQYKKELLEQWVELAKSAHRVMMFGYVVRFLRDLDASQRTQIQAAVLSELGHLDQVKDCF